MRTLLSLTALASVIFGVPLLVIPDVLVSIFGIKLDIAGNLFARILGASWLGYAVFNWNLRDSANQVVRQIVYGDLIVAVVGLILSLYTVATNLGNALVWLWVVLFLSYGVAFVYFLWVRPQPA